MKTIGRFEFPETREEAKHWKEYRTQRALAREVLAVAHTRIEGAWCAYIDSVPGRSHQEEAEQVFFGGNGLSERVARAMFPDFDGVPYSE